MKLVLSKKKKEEKLTFPNKYFVIYSLTQLWPQSRDCLLDVWLGGGQGGLAKAGREVRDGFVREHTGLEGGTICPEQRQASFCWFQKLYIFLFHFLSSVSLL